MPKKKTAESDIVPFGEIEAAADAIRILWESDECQEAIKATGRGPGYLFVAKVALEAAAKVRGRIHKSPQAHQ